MQKIIQFQIGRDNDRKKGGRTEIYALTEDGSLYVGRYGPINEEHPQDSKWTLYWIKLPDIPKT